MKKRLLQSIAVLFLAGVVVWFCLPSYLRKALIYQHPGIDDYQIFHNRIVDNGPPQPWPLHPEYNKARTGASTEKYFELYGTVAFLVVQEQSLLHEEYFDGYSDTTLSGSFSMAKSIVSLLVGCLLDDGKIQNLDDPITKYLKGIKNPVYSRIRISDLLTMSSGLEWDEAYSSATSITTEAYYGSDLRTLVTSLEMDTVPGKRFDYQSCDTQLLAMIVEKAAGMPLSDYVSKKLWKPLGAESKALWSLDSKEGIEKAYCCFNSNARDFARIGQLVLDSGDWKGRQLISKEYLRKATSPASWLKDENGRPCNFYGFQFWMLTYKGMKINYARGIGGQYIFIIPHLNAVVVRLGHKRSESKRNGIPTDIYQYLDAALEILKPGTVAEK